MTQPLAETLPKTYFEDVLPHTGWGLYYKFMVAMACAASFSQATAFFTMPFAIALSSCEYSITKSTILDLDMSFMLGRVSGGLILNGLCDIYGRKRVLTHTMLLIFISNFVAAFAYNYLGILIPGFILASGLEANYCVVRVHLAEILPLNRRGLFLGICDVFWSLGYLFVSLLGIFLKDPLMTETNAADMRLAYWKMLFAIAGGLNITVACATALLEESPRFFLHIKKYYLALLTLKQFYAINKSSYGEYLEDNIYAQWWWQFLLFRDCNCNKTKSDIVGALTQVKETDLINIVNPQYPSIYPDSSGCMNTLKNIIKLMVNNIRELFSKNFLRTTIILLIIKLPLLIFGHLNLNIMLTKLSPDTSVMKDGIGIIHFDRWKNFTLCTNMDRHEMLYYVYFTLVIAVMIGIIIVTCFVDYLGRRILACVGLMLCGVCYIAVFSLKNITGKIILSTVLMTSFSAAITTVSVINIESYPTALRCTSWGLFNFPGLLVGHLVIRYYHLLANYFFISHAVLFYGAAIAAYFLHDLKRKPMVE